MDRRKWWLRLSFLWCEYIRCLRHHIYVSGNVSPARLLLYLMGSQSHISPSMHCLCLWQYRLFRESTSRSPFSKATKFSFTKHNTSKFQTANLKSETSLVSGSRYSGNPRTEFPEKSFLYLHKVPWNWLDPKKPGFRWEVHQKGYLSQIRR